MREVPQMIFELKSIDDEAAACRAAWAAMPEAQYAAHLHHEVACEPLSEPIENRIAYILREKPEAERALRLRLMRPVTATASAEYERVRAPALAEYERVRATAWAEYERVKATAWAEYERVMATAHLLICSVYGCPFDGRTIFPEVKP
jgi:hypothetical protein